MTDVSEQHVKFNRPCLEPCLRQLRYLIEERHEQDIVSVYGPLTTLKKSQDSLPLKFFLVLTFEKNFLILKFLLSPKNPVFFLLNTLLV